MKTATDILQERISSYNETVSDFSKIRFTSKELGIFTGGMEEYASQFHPSPKEISEEEIEKILKEEIYIHQYGYMNGNADLMGIKDASIAIVKVLSLPSSGSKTEAVDVLE